MVTLSLFVMGEKSTFLDNRRETASDVWNCSKLKRFKAPRVLFKPFVSAFVMHFSKVEAANKRCVLGVLPILEGKG